MGTNAARAAASRRRVSSARGSPAITIWTGFESWKSSAASNCGIVSGFCFTRSPKDPKLRSAAARHSRLSVISARRKRFAIAIEFPDGSGPS